MNNFIGGLFKKREDAERARSALRENGVGEESINLLQCTHNRDAVILDKNPSIKSIGKGALTGAIILGGIGGFLGLLVGLGVIHVPTLDSASAAALPFQITWQFIMASIASGLLLGVLTGAIIGAAVQLAMPNYQKVNVSQGADKGDLLLAVQANDTEKEVKVRSILKEYGAIKFEEFKEKWDSEIWSVFNEEQSQVRS